MADAPAARWDDQRGTRSHPRRDTVLRCWLGEPDLQRFARITNIGPGGARVITANPPPVGTRVELRFRMRPDGPEIHASGEVAWRREGIGGRGGLMGVMFDVISDTSEVTAFVGEAT